MSLGVSDKQLLINPTLYNIIFLYSNYQQSFHNLNSVVSDFLSYHSISFSIHVLLLISIKSVDFSTKLFPDKSSNFYVFPCDGNGRGGTCDISPWDSFYLSFFWMLNAVS
jgi:hypothetical protein